MQKRGIRSGVTPAASDTGRIRPLERSGAGHRGLVTELVLCREELLKPGFVGLTA